MLTTITLTPLTPPRKAIFAGGRTYVAHNPTTLAPAGSLAIGAGGSSATADATAKIAPAPPWAPGGTVVRISSGVLAGFVPTVGITVTAPPPAPPADCTAALTARDTAWRTALGKVAP
jgi:hypothetical protein